MDHWLYVSLLADRNRRREVKHHQFIQNALKIYVTFLKGIFMPRYFRKNQSLIKLGLMSFALLVASASSAQMQPKIKKHADYGTAVRATLLQQGYKPLALPKMSEEGECDAESECADRCYGDTNDGCWPELRYRSGTGLARASYLWEKGKTLLEVCTIGETPNFHSYNCTPK